MPFIKPERRVTIDHCGLEVLPTIQSGDRCYCYYKQMVEKWKAEPRWTTAHNLYKEVCNTWQPREDAAIALQLAWQVFFQLHVMPYELKKREENGDI